MTKPTATEYNTRDRDQCCGRGILIRVGAVRNRMSLRETDVIRAPQHPPPTNELCQYTAYGFAPDTRSRTAERPEHYVAGTTLANQD